MAIRYLPWFCSNPLPASNDLIDFTEKDGWQKVDKLLPLIDRWGSMVGQQGWTSRIGAIFEHLKVCGLHLFSKYQLRVVSSYIQERKPETSGFMSEIQEKWKRIIWDLPLEEWESIKKNRAGQGSKDIPQATSSHSQASILSPRPAHSGVSPHTQVQSWATWIRAYWTFYDISSRANTRCYSGPQLSTKQS